MTKRTYDSTIARVAGNIASGLLMEPPQAYMTASDAPQALHEIAVVSVRLARAIIAEVERTDDTAVHPVVEEGKTDNARLTRHDEGTAERLREQNSSSSSSDRERSA
jgi:hypothetical protein